MDGSSEPVVRLPEQAGDVSIGTAAQNIYQGANADRLVSMVEMLVKNAWDDAQARDVRQHEIDFHREMVRQRLEKIADDVAETQRMGVELRRWLIGLTLALIVVVAVVVAVVADRLGVMAVALLVATLAARLGR